MPSITMQNKHRNLDGLMNIKDETLYTSRQRLPVAHSAVKVYTFGLHDSINYADPRISINAAHHNCFFTVLAYALRLC